MKSHVLAVAVAVLAVPSFAPAQRADTLRLSLQDAIARAQDASDEVRITLAQQEIADAQVGTARASGLPQIRVNTSYQHVFENARSNAIGQVFNQPDSYNATLQVSQTFFQGGRIRAGLRAAADTRYASRLDEQEVRGRLTVDVQRAYMQVLYTDRIVEIQQSNLKNSTDRAKQIEQLLSAGRASRWDPLESTCRHASLSIL